MCIRDSFGTTRLELWLDECNDVAARPQHWRDDRKDPTQRDERHVDTDDIDGTRQIRQRQVASVEVLNYHDAWIVSNRPVKLPVPDVERHDPCGTALEQYVGESTS